MSGARALDATDVVFFDGDRPLPRAVTSMQVSGDTLAFVAGDTTHHWPLSGIRAVADTAGGRGTLLRCEGDPLARLYRPTPFDTGALPRPFRPAPPRGRGRLAAWALAAVAAVAVQILVLIPLLADNLAGFIPPEGERALGEATFGQIREALSEAGMAPVALCEAPEGVAALSRMTARVTDAGEIPVEVFVLNHPMINAFALPGGYVVLFDGLIEAAQSPDEVAAVLAHEVGHVVSRDPTRHALRSAGSIGVLGLLFGDFAGGAVVLLLAERLISAQYSQAAEAAADAHAHAALERAGVSAAALGRMFERLREAHGDSEGLAAHFLSHPALRDRIEAARAAADPAAQYAPVLDDADWRALQAICE